MSSSQQKRSRRCSECGKTEHIQENCRGKGKSALRSDEYKFFIINYFFLKSSDGDTVLAIGENKPRKRESRVRRKNKAQIESVNAMVLSTTVDQATAF